MNLRGHSKKNFKDVQSVSLIQNLLATHQRVMPKLHFIDKWPYIDGTLEFQDQNGNLIGKFEVQIKTLPNNHNLKISCPISFINYCKQIPTIPILFLGVDNDNSKVYWLYVNDSFINRLDIKTTNLSKTIEFDGDKVISKNNKNYILEWEKILITNREKYRIFEENIEAYSVANQSSNISSIEQSSYIDRIHNFLDKLNFYLDNKFQKIKDIFFKNAWKVGIAYDEFSNKSLSFYIYPIFNDKFDSQIKKINKKIYKQLFLEKLTFRGYCSENPILSRPDELIFKLLSDYSKGLIENKLLDYKNEFLALEFIFAFIEKFNVQLGLELKNEYKIKEVEKAFFKYLPIWTEEAKNLLISKGKHNEYKIRNLSTANNLPVLNPEIILSAINPRERIEIDKNVKFRLKNDIFTSPFYLVNDKLPIGIFIELFDFLKITKKNNFLRTIYKRKNYERLHKIKSNWIWDIYSSEDIEYNIKLFFSEFPLVYHNFLVNNFPDLINELSFFGDSDKVVVIVLIKDKIKDHSDVPSYKMFHLKSKENIHDVKTIDVYINESDKDFDKYLSEEIKYKNNFYILRSWKDSFLNFIYKDTPMLDYIHEILNFKLEQYFNKNRKIIQENE